MSHPCQKPKLEEMSYLLRVTTPKGWGQHLRPVLPKLKPQDQDCASQAEVAAYLEVA